MAIPGVTTIIRDRFYTVSRTDTPAGPRIVVIAKRKSGASNSAAVADLDVVRASNEADVISAFGDGSGLAVCMAAVVVPASGMLLKFNTSSSFKEHIFPSLVSLSSSKISALTCTISLALM